MSLKEAIGKWMPLTGRRWPAATKWLSLVIGCLAMAISTASFMSVFVWQSAMRAILNQTETEINIVSSLGNFGFAAFAFPAGILYDLVGNQVVTFISTASLTLAYVFLSLGTGDEGSWRHEFATNLWIPDILYLMVGIGCAFMSMAMLMSNVANFPYQRRGVIFGILVAFYSLGPAILSLIYNLAFTNGHVKVGTEGQQDLCGYFLTVGMMSLAINIAALFLVGKVKTSDEAEQVNEEEKTETDPIVANADEPIAPPNNFSDFPFEELGIRAIVRKANFWLQLLQFVLILGVIWTYQNNIPTQLQSYDLNSSNLVVTILNTLVSSVSKVAAGFLSDKLAKRGKYPRSIIQIVPYALQTIIFFVSFFVGDRFPTVILTCIFVGFANGVLWSQTPTILGELYGGVNLGTNWGFTMMFTTFTLFPLSIGFGSIYESNIERAGELYCYGLSCFRWSYLLFSGVSLVGLIMVVILTRNMMQNAEKRRSLRNQSQMGESFRESIGSD